MTPICTIICENCGKFAIMHENGLSIFILNKEFFAMSRCPFCDRPVQDSIEKNVVMELFYQGVNIFNFKNGELVASIEEINNL